MMHKPVQSFYSLLRSVITARQSVQKTSFEERERIHITARQSDRSRRQGGLLIPILLFALFISACSPKEKFRADLIVHNAVVYTVDSTFTTAQSFAVKDGKILATGTNEDILSSYDAAEKIDAGGKAVFPGFIDAHCHFYAYGQSLHTVNLVGTKSWDEVLQRTLEFSKTSNSEWITGRGWDQNDWEIKEFPDRKKLDSLFPGKPVILMRIDGHAAMANGEALKRAGITETTKIDGGEIGFMFTWTGKKWGSSVSEKLVEAEPSGLLVDNAVTIVNRVIPAPSKEEMTSFLLDAQKNCFEAGLTTVDDAGLMKNVIDIMDELQKEGKLKMRIYAMLSDSTSNYDHYLKAGPYKTDRLNVRSFKIYGDGALGSRGACLLQPYSDAPGQTGFLLNTVEHYKERAKQLAGSGFQMNTHCIGDSANRLILNIYMNALASKGAGSPAPSQFRWRIEHVQVVDPADIKWFENGAVIPSVQPTHATSDMYWAKDRLGEERVKSAYAYKDLLKAAGMIALGTDFPIEQVNPMTTFYAAITRTDREGFPNGGYQMENALTREETLKGMTIWAAYSNFEEKEKGSIEPGKFADFVILDKDVMKADTKELLSTKVVATYVNGEKVYGK
jgi:predicted amidohydrolase YtcJ